MVLLNRMYSIYLKKNKPNSGIFIESLKDGEKIVTALNHYFTARPFGGGAHEQMHCTIHGFGFILDFKNYELCIRHAHTHTHTLKGDIYGWQEFTVNLEISRSQFL